MSMAGSSMAWITVTDRVWVLKSYFSSYCIFPRYPLAGPLAKKEDRMSRIDYLSLSYF